MKPFHLGPTWVYKGLPPGTYAMQGGGIHDGHRYFNFRGYHKCNGYTSMVIGYVRVSTMFRKVNPLFHKNQTTPQSPSSDEESGSS